MLEQFIIVTAYQPKRGKKSPIHELKAESLIPYSRKEEVLKAAYEFSTLSGFEDVVIKSIYSVNEFGHITFYDVVFNGKLFLQTIMNPCSPKTSETYAEDDLPFYNIDDMLDGDTDEEIKTDKRPKRIKPPKHESRKRTLESTCTTCGNEFKDCICHPGLGDDD